MRSAIILYLCLIGGFAFSQASGDKSQNVTISAVPSVTIHPTKDPSDYVLIVATVLLVVVGGGQLYFLKKTIEVAKESADAASKSASVAEGSLLLTERPKLTVRFMQPHQTSRSTVAGDFLLFNTGGSKAILHRHYSEVIIASHLPAVAPYMGKHGDAFTNVQLDLGQSTNVSFGPRELDVEEYMKFWNSAETPNHPHNLYVTGWVEYADPAGKIRRMGFCRRFDFETKRLLREYDKDYEYDN